MTKTNLKPSFRVWYVTDNGMKFKEIKALSKDEARELFKAKSEALVASVVPLKYYRLGS